MGKLQLGHDRAINAKPAITPDNNNPSMNSFEYATVRTLKIAKLTPHIS